MKEKFDKTSFKELRALYAKSGMFVTPSADDAAAAEPAHIDAKNQMTSKPLDEKCTLWFIDAKQMAIGLKEASDWAKVELFVYLTHALIFDENTQLHGVIFLEDMQFIGFLEAMKIISPKTKKRSDKLMMGSMSIKMKKFVIIRAPWWCRWLTKLMYPFLSKKMRARFEMVGENWLKLKREIGGDWSVMPPNFACGMGQCSEPDKFFGIKFGVNAAAGMVDPSFSPSSCEAAAGETKSVDAQI